MRKHAHPASKVSNSKSSILQTAPSKGDLGFKINLIVALDSKLSKNLIKQISKKYNKSLNRIETEIKAHRTDSKLSFQSFNFDKLPTQTVHLQILAYHIQSMIIHIDINVIISRSQFPLVPLGYKQAIT